MKKLLSTILAVAMILLMFAGCGNAATSEAAEQSASASAAAEAAEAPEPDAEDDAQPEEASAAEPEEAEASVEDLPEAEFDIYGPFSDEEVVLTYWKLWPPFLEGYDPMDASLFATLYDALNVRVDVTTVGTDSADTKFNLMVASGDYLDLLENADSNYPGGGTKAIQDEVLIDMMPYMQVYAPDYWAMLQKDEVAMKTAIDSAGQMSYMVTLYDEIPVPQSGLWTRKDWLEVSAR